MLVLIVIVCQLAPGLLAQQQTQQAGDVRVATLIAQADSATLGLRSDDAAKYVDEAIALAEKIGDRLGLAMSFRQKGLNLVRLGAYRDALPFYERAVKELESLGNRQQLALALTGLGNAQSGAGVQWKDSFDRASDIYRELGDELGGARAIALRMRNESVSPAWETQSRELLSLGTKFNDLHLIQLVAQQLGSALFNRGSLTEAAALFDRALAAAERVSDLRAVATVHLNLGRIQRAHGDYAGAIVRYQIAIDTLSPTKERFVIVEAHNAKAIALGALGRRTESLAAYEQGLALALESGNQQLIDFMEGNLAGGLNTTRDFARAIPILEALIAKKPELRLLGYRYNSLAYALLSLGRFEEALHPINEAIRIARETNNADALVPRIDNRTFILSSLKRNEEALKDAREVIALAEQVRARLLPSDFLKQGYGDSTSRAYVIAVDLLSKMGLSQDALETAEQGRARAFLDLLATSTSSPTELTTRGAAPVARGITDLESNSVGRPVTAVEMGAIAKRLNSTLVSYWITDDSAIAWIVPPGGQPTQVRLSARRESLAPLVAATTALLTESAKRGETRGDSAEELVALPLRGMGVMALSRDQKTSWRALYQLLIEPIRAHLPARGGRLTIVPHGPLFQLSFAALQNPAGRYLVEDYELHFAPAISALAFTDRLQQLNNANAAGPWAIVGNPSKLPVVGKQPLAPLPGAAREIASIAALAPKGKAVRLDGAAATEGSLEKVLGQSRPSVLHFATHGFVFDDAAIPPFLALTASGSSPSEDGRLTLNEVYNLKLSANLVVLSACRTGSGRVSSDGIIGLTRGFFYAGAPSVMATYWDVNDEATSILMSSFYRAYARAGAKSRSLRSAQLALLADLRAGRVAITVGGRKVTLPEHPLLWAAFFLSGEP